MDAIRNLHSTPLPHSPQRVTHLSCGNHHVAAIDENHNLYTWGSGGLGRLGLGDELDRNSPCQVVFSRAFQPVKVCVARENLQQNNCFNSPLLLPLSHAHLPQVVCGPDATVVLSSSGQMMGCGNNEYDKLCLNSSGSILARRRDSVKIKPMKSAIGGREWWLNVG